MRDHSRRGDLAAGQEQLRLPRGGRQAALTKVEIGNRSPGSVEILKGLAANDIIITDGQISSRTERR